jgi:hypothetical protein
MDHDYLCAFIGGHGLCPAAEPDVKEIEKALSVSLEVGAIRRDQAYEASRLLGYGARVLRVEPVVGVAESVQVSPSVRPQSWSLSLQKLYSLRGVKIVRATACKAGILDCAQDTRKPRLMVKADPDEKLGGLELAELGWLDLRSMGILERRGQALH